MKDWRTEGNYKKFYFKDAMEPLDQLTPIYESLLSSPSKKKRSGFPKEVQVFVRVQQTTAEPKTSIESKHFLRKLWISFRGTAKEYKFESNAKAFSTLIQKGFEQIAKGKGNPEDLKKVAACLLYYQDLVRYYAVKHFKGNESSKTNFIETNLFAPFAGFEKTLDEWAKGADTGKKIFSVYAKTILAKAKERALDQELSDEERTALLANTFSFLTEAERFQGLVTPQLQNLGKLIPEGSSLRSEYAQILRQWEDLQNPPPDFTGPLDVITLLEYLAAKYDPLFTKSNILSLKVHAAHGSLEAQRHQATKILSLIPLAQRISMRQEPYRTPPEKLLVFMKNSVEKISEEKSDTENLEERLSQLERIVPQGSGPWEKSLQEAHLLMDELQKPISTPEERSLTVEQVLENVAKKRKALAQVLDRLEKSLIQPGSRLDIAKQAQELLDASQRHLETVPDREKLTEMVDPSRSASLEEDTTALGRITQEHSVALRQRAQQSIDDLSGSASLSLDDEIFLAQTTEDLQKAQTPSELAAVLDDIHQHMQQRVEIEEPAIPGEAYVSEVDRGLERTAQTIEILSRKAEVGQRLSSLKHTRADPQLIAQLEHEIENADTVDTLSELDKQLKQIEKQGEARVSVSEEASRIRAPRKVKPNPLLEEIEKVRAEIERNSQSLEEDQDLIVIVDMITAMTAWARSQLTVQKDPQATLEHLKKVRSALNGIFFLVYESPSQEKHKQLRLWALRAISLAVTTEEKRETLAEEISRLCDNARLSFSQKEQTCDIEATLKQIDDFVSSFASPEVVWEILPELHEQYRLAQETNRRLSDPRAETIHEPMHWHNVVYKFNQIRAPVEQTLPGVLAQLQSLQATAQHIEEQKQKFQTIVGRLRSTYSNVRGVSETCTVIEEMIGQEASSSSKEWPDIVNSLLALAKNLEAILSIQEKSEKQKHLTTWMLFGITCAYHQSGMKTTSAQVSAVKRFSDLALDHIQHTEERASVVDHYESVLERASKINEVLAKRHQSLVPLLQLPEYLIPDFQDVEKPSPVHPLNWKAIAETYETHRSQMQQDCIAFEHRVALAEAESEDSQHLITQKLKEIRQTVRSDTYRATIQEQQYDRTIRSLLPTDTELEETPPERLKSLLHVLQGIIRCIDILKNKEQASEYQLQAAQSALKHLQKEIQGHSLQAKTILEQLLRPSLRRITPEPVTETEILEAVAGKETAQPPQELLESLENIMDVERDLTQSSAISQRNISAEFKALTQLFRQYPSSCDPILDQSFQRARKTGQELLNDIEAILSVSPGSVEDVQKLRAEAVSALSLLYGAVDKSLQAAYAAKKEALQARLLELRKKSKESLGEHTLQIIELCSAFLKKLPIQLGSFSSQYTENAQILKSLEEIERSLSDSKLQHYAYQEPLEPRYLAIQKTVEQRPESLGPMAKTWEEALAQYKELLHPSIERLPTDTNPEREISQRRAQLEKNLVTLEQHFGLQASLEQLETEYKKLDTDLTALDNERDACSKTIKKVLEKFRQAYDAGYITEDGWELIQQRLSSLLTAISTPLLSSSLVREFVDLKQAKDLQQANKILATETAHAVELFSDVEANIREASEALQSLGLPIDVSEEQLYAEKLKQMLDKMTMS
jgi:uncharacterized membrane-anchored protein YhcB (DUF1043 family)